MFKSFYRLFVSVAIILGAQTASAQSVKLRVVSDVAVKAGTASLRLTNPDLEGGRFPGNANISCSLIFKSEDFDRKLKKDSTYLITLPGQGHVVNLTKCSVPEMREEIERIFAKKLSTNLDTREKLTKFISQTYGEKINDVDHYRRTFNVTSVNTAKKYLLTCDAYVPLSANLALEAIGVSNIMTFDREL